MAYARRRTPEIRPRLEIKQGVLDYLNDVEIAEGDSETLFEVLGLTAGDEQGLRELWKRARAEVLTTWIKGNPGTRPSAWWKFDTREPRRLLSGAGCPAWVVLGYAESYTCGLPTLWAGFEPSDAPIFEGQTAYLSRHSLLLASEKRCLRPSDYAETEQLDPGCAVDLGPFAGSDPEGVRWLNQWGERIRKRIPPARGIGVDCAAASPVTTRLPLLKRKEHGE